jgi:nitrate reductase NapE component
MNAMRDDTLRNRTSWALWLILAITLLPLVPYALRGAGW